MKFEDYIIPYILSNAIGLLLIFVCWKWPKAGKVIWGILFIAAGLFNGYHAVVSPEVYVETYGPAAVLPLYRNFIEGIFSQHTALFLSLIASGQILVGFFLFMRKLLLILGIIGGIVFLLAISPLGIGAAFPSTLLMALSLLVLWRRSK